MAVSNNSIDIGSVLLSCMLTEDKVTNIFANPFSVVTFLVTVW